MKCDPVSGACTVPNQDSHDETSVDTPHKGAAVHYIGDPMCSWCWGLAPTVKEVESFCEKHGLLFSITLGGLRVGGGELWDSAFKGFLQQEWRHINDVTGQAIGFSLLDLEYFDYDTEPACRAVVTVKLLQEKNTQPSSILLKFYTAIQQKFYVDGQDPKLINFYESICASLGLNFAEFCQVFESQKARQAIEQEFLRCRHWGVHSFPTLLIESRGKVRPLVVGYMPAAKVLSLLQEALSST